MWKRWSLKPTPANDATSKVDLQSPSTEDGRALSSVQESSVKPETTAETTTAEITSPEPAEVANTQALNVMDGNSVASDAPVNPAVVEMASDSVLEGVLAADGDAKPLTELADGSTKDRASLPHVMPQVEDTPKVPASGDGDSTSPATMARPVDGVSRDAVVNESTQTEGDLDTATPDNKLSVSVPEPEPEQPLPRPRRLSFRSLAFFYGSDKHPKSSPTSPSPEHKGLPAAPVKTKPRASPKPKLSHSEKKALSSALILRSLIIGPGAATSADASIHGKVKQHKKLVASPPPADLKKVKSHLLKPKSANAVIAQLRRLPLPDGPTFHASANASSESLVTHPDAGGTPIHAVCLPYTDEEADKIYFSRLRAGHAHGPSLSPQDTKRPMTTSSDPMSVGTASLESLIDVMRDLRLVSLLTSPDLGFGQPVSEQDTGPLTGSVPSAGTLANGFEEITKQLMSLGFATSKAVFPSHVGIYPPEDRMSVLTYWWGLELVIPEPSVKYLGKVKSISHTMLNFLSAVSLFNNGVREVLPFIRYIANYVDFEWSAIQSQDRGRGVVCAATWIMPAAMVPRPWDFPPRPASNSGSSAVPTAAAPALPTFTPASPNPVPHNDANNEPPIDSPPLGSNPTAPPSVLYPPAPAIPMLPTLTVTPATLPRGSTPPHQPEMST